MTGWQWFGLGMLFIVLLGILSTFTHDFQNFLRVVIVGATLVIVGLGIMSLVLGTWIPW